MREKVIPGHGSQHFPSGISWIWILPGDTGSRVFRKSVFLQVLCLNPWIIRQGRATEQGVYLDAQAAFDYIDKRPDIDSKQIVIFGRSLGTIILLFDAKENFLRFVAHVGTQLAYFSRRRCRHRFSYPESLPRPHCSRSHREHLLQSNRVDVAHSTQVYDAPYKAVQII